jgi:hypothetical protein
MDSIYVLESTQTKIVTPVEFIRLALGQQSIRSDLRVKCKCLEDF